jgi:uncharacterized protein (DUF2267 family)
MQYDEFLDQVQERANLDSKQAEAAVKATLLTLSERLFGYEAQNLAQQLPEELRTYLRLSAEKNPFDLEEFYQRVAFLTEADQDQARRQARAVISVLKDAVEPQEIENLRDELPEEYDALFEPEEVG